MVTLDDPGESVIDPHVYVLCAGCADKLMPPRGWTLQDRRQKPPLFLERDPRTVTVDVVDVIGDEASVPEPAPQHSRQLFFGHSA